VATLVNPPGQGNSNARDELETTAAGINTGAFPAGAVPFTVSFDYVVSGTVTLIVEIERPGQDVQVTIGPLSGSGTVSVTFPSNVDPTTIQEIQIESFGNTLGEGESITLDNLYVGPTSGAGGAATVAVQSWQEVVP
jgi:hypothetical protein